MRSGSDVDVLIVGAASFAECVEALVPAQERLVREVNPTVFPAEEFREKARAHNPFVARILAGPKIFLVGSERELARLADEPLASAQPSAARSASSIAASSSGSVILWPSRRT